MVSKEGIIVLDSNLFIIDLRYKRDRHYRINRAFLDSIPTTQTVVITIVNLLEVCGILSFSLSEQQILELYHYLPERYHVEVVPSHSFYSPLPAVTVDRLLGLISRKMSFGDALVMTMVETHVPYASFFISWDAAHFRGKTSIPVMTPEEFLQRG